MNNPDQVKIAATNLYESKKCYMLLLGSGVSKEAGIKTVYELNGDLIKTAYSKSVSDAAGPNDCHKTNLIKEPDYSSLIETVNKQAGNRRDWLKPNFKDKKPTKAHQAIAQLVKQEYIKIILTTNFDRLMENALDKVGIAPNVIVNEADVDRLGHIESVDCVLIKLNGDYCSLDMKNTSVELQSYSKKITKFVTYQLAVSGLIISGWSAECDTGLVKILNEKFKSTQMYQSYWGSINETYSDTAEKLCELGGITKITHHTADNLFTKLLEEINLINSENNTVTHNVKSMYKEQFEYGYSIEEEVLEELKHPERWSYVTGKRFYHSKKRGMSINISDNGEIKNRVNFTVLFQDKIATVYKYEIHYNNNLIKELEVLLCASGELLVPYPNNKPVGEALGVDTSPISYYYIKDSYAHLLKNFLTHHFPEESDQGSTYNHSLDIFNKIVAEFDSENDAINKLEDDYNSNERKYTYFHRRRGGCEVRKPDKTYFVEWETGVNTVDDQKR